MKSRAADAGRFDGRGTLTSLPRAPARAASAAADATLVARPRLEGFGSTLASIQGGMRSFSASGGGGGGGGGGGIAGALQARAASASPPRAFLKASIRVGGAASPGN
jgi:hypothetical protein